MNGVISLCHFCELHGPCVLISTQSFHKTDTSASQVSASSFYGNTETLSTECVPSTCEACHALSPSTQGFLSHDHEARVSYLSTRLPMQPEVASLVRQACVRSLSCEVSPGKEGGVYFGDDTRGHVLSRTFFLRDSRARGFHRWFSVTVLMRDKLYLLHSWPFFMQHIARMLARLQAAAAKVYEREQLAQPQRSLRLTSERSPQSERSLPALTDDSLIFRRLHVWFTWLLRAGAGRLQESLPVEVKHSADPGAVSPCAGLPELRSLRQLRRAVGTATFTALSFGLVVGRQVVVRGQPSSLVTSTINCLEQLLPETGRKVVASSEVYEPDCQLLGVETRVAVPRISERVLRLDVLPPTDDEWPTDPADYLYKLNWAGDVPNKCPTYLVKILRSMDNPNLSDGVMRYHLISLREEWLNIARVVGRVDPAADVTRLMQTLGVQEQDKPVITYWATLS